MKTRCPVAENSNETSDVNTLIWDSRLSVGDSYPSFPFEQVSNYMYNILLALPGYT